MLFLTLILGLTTLLLCYAGYIFLVVDKRQESAVLEDPDLYEALDDKNYTFELPEQIDTYEDLRVTEGRSVADVLEGPLFARLVVASWARPSVAQGKLRTCSAVKLTDGNASIASSEAPG